MNDDLQKALAVILQKTTHAAETGAAFLQAELPEVIRQLLMWKAVQSFIWFALALTACVILFRKSREYFKAHKVGSFDGFDLVGGLAAIGSGLTFVIAMLSTAWLQILIAPKVYLIEYAARLAK